MTFQLQLAAFVQIGNSVQTLNEQKSIHSLTIEYNDHSGQNQCFHGETRNDMI